MGAYRKIHLFDSQGFRESRHIKPGPDLRPLVVEVAGVPMAVLTCYDLRFPELARAAADAGARVLLAPSSWVPGPGKADHWNVLSRARALDNGLFVVAVSQAEPISIGRSLVADPFGTILAECGPGPTTATVQLPLERVAEARRMFPLHEQRRL